MARKIAIGTNILHPLFISSKRLRLIIRSATHMLIFIRLSKDATGTTNITNSEIAYLGYSCSRSSGIIYYGGEGCSHGRRLY
jgi:hypothetical protein